MNNGYLAIESGISIQERCQYRTIGTVYITKEWLKPKNPNLAQYLVQGFSNCVPWYVGIPYRGIRESSAAWAWSLGPASNSIGSQLFD